MIENYFTGAFHPSTCAPLAEREIITFELSKLNYDFFYFYLLNLI